MTDKTYDVGYGKPPRHRQFKPGQSGNPKGKPRGAKNLATIITRAIREKVPVTHNGRRRKVSKLEIAITQLVNRAATGDHKATMQLLPLVQMLESRAEAAAPAAPVLTAADEATMAGIQARIQRRIAAAKTARKPSVKENRS